MFALKAQARKPVHREILPVLEPLEVCIRLAEKLHLHLLELARAEREVAGRDLIAEGLSDLADAERELLSGGSLDILEVHENALCCLGTQINRIGRIFRDALERLEHQIELTDIGPVKTAAGRAGNLELVDEAHHFVIAPAVDTAVERHIMCLRVVLDQIVSAKTFAAGLAVHQRIRESGQMSGCDPGLRIHEDRAVNTDVCVRFLHELSPPCLLHVVFHLNAKRAVIPGV